MGSLQYRAMIPQQNLDDACRVAERLPRPIRFAVEAMHCLKGKIKRTDMPELASSSPIYPKTSDDYKIWILQYRDMIKYQNLDDACMD